MISAFLEEAGAKLAEGKAPLGNNSRYVANPLLCVSHNGQFSQTLGPDTIRCPVCWLGVKLYGKERVCQISKQYSERLSFSHSIGLSYADVFGYQLDGLIGWSFAPYVVMGDKR